MMAQRIARLRRLHGWSATKARQMAPLIYGEGRP